MNYKNTLSLFALIGLLAFVGGCKKITQTSEVTIPKVVLPEIPAGVYAVGITSNAANNFGKATLWKDGVLTVLSDKQSLANAIAIKGKEMYVVGSIRLDAQMSACVWYNKEVSRLTSGRDHYAEATAVTFPGKDVYVAGNIYPTATTQVAAYWKNGFQTTLSADGAKCTARGIAAIGDDVYVSGYYTAPNGNVAACYWKNGKFIKLTDEWFNSSAHGITTHGNDVYIAGYTERALGNLDRENVGIVWKNGVGEHLPKPANASRYNASAVTIANGEMYVVGSALIGTAYQAVYWYPHVTSLIPGSGYGDAIAVQGTDVYIGGARLHTSNAELTQGVIWKNRTLQLTEPNVSEIRGIAIVQ